MAKSLTVDITKDGIIIDAEGFKEAECETEIKAIEAELEQLGIHVDRKDRKVKAEMYVHSSPSTGQRV